MDAFCVISVLNYILIIIFIIIVIIVVAVPAILIVRRNMIQRIGIRLGFHTERNQSE